MWALLLSFSSLGDSLWISDLPHGPTPMFLPTCMYSSLRTGPHCFHCNHNKMVNDIVYILFFLLTLGNLVSIFYLQHISIRMYHVSDTQQSHAWLLAAILDSVALGQSFWTLAGQWSHLGTFKTLMQWFWCDGAGLLRLRSLLGWEPLVCRALFWEGESFPRLWPDLFPSITMRLTL